jgi:hypothetical protein
MVCGALTEAVRNILYFFTPGLKQTTEHLHTICGEDGNRRRGEHWETLRAGILWAVRFPAISLRQLQKVSRHQ